MILTFTLSRIKKLISNEYKGIQQIYVVIFSNTLLSWNKSDSIELEICNVLTTELDKSS